MVKVTQWFDAIKEKPVHTGVYEVCVQSDLPEEPAGFARWTGEQWSYVSFVGIFKDREWAIEHANESPYLHEAGFVTQWRGVAK